MKNDAPQRVSVFLVDDHPLVRQGLAVMLEQAGFAVGGEAESIKATLAHPGLAAAQVAILDLSLDRANGLDLIPVLSRQGIRVVVYSMHEDAAVVRGALAAGAKGYITKREAAQSLVAAIRTVLDGGDYVSPRAASGLAQRVTDPDLSRQQEQLYDLLGEGCDAQEIAARLHVSPRTVETYCTRLMDKMGLAGMKELRRHAISDRQRRSL
ncbi:MAG: response regulator transcription factor [Acidobacteria bacterium]|nr:response regulator transcription factor [Acidobacteriota bacterium]